MKQDLTTTWEAANNKNALVQSIQTQVDLETKYATNNNHEQHPIMPLVIFIPADADSSKTLLQSKSCMDCLIEELKNPNSIHLICLGKECDFDSTSTATTSTSRDGDPNRNNDPLDSRGFSPSTNSNTKQPANTLQLLQAMQNAFSSCHLPSGCPSPCPRDTLFSRLIKTCATTLFWSTPCERATLTKKYLLIHRKSDDVY
jgi:hypothetical protein